MKIDKLPELKIVTIKDLQSGDCFTYPDREMALMKTSNINVNNVINLHTGNLSNVHEDTIIIPLPNSRVIFSEKTNSSTEEEKKEWYDYTFKEIRLNYCRKAFGCKDCPIGEACSDYMRIDDLMNEVDEDIIFE